MKTPKHTKGPWIVDTRAYNKTGILIGPNGQDAIADINRATMRSQSENQANAHLIAAAPEMLEALETMSRYIGSLEKNKISIGMKSICDFTIKKARGES